MASDIFTPPATKPVTSGGGAARPEVTYSTKLPAMGGVPEQQAELATQQAEAGLAAAQQGQADIDAAAAEQNAQNAAGLQAQAENHALDVQKLQDELGPRLKRISEEADKAIADASSRHYVNHWAQQSTGTKVLAAISSFLGGFATGRPVSRAQEWIDAEYAHQKAEMDALWRVAEARGAQREHLSAMMESAMRNLQAQYVARQEAVKAQIDQQVAARGTEQARVNGEKLKAEADMKAAARRAEMARGMEIQIMGHSMKALGARGLETRKLKDGRVVWKDPATGMWEEFIIPGRGPATTPKQEVERALAP
jgi:hypothetical protein